jgi:hypothetical protein
VISDGTAVCCVVATRHGRPPGLPRWPSAPSGTVRRVIFPVVGGEKTLKALADEARCKARVRTVLRSSYSVHWRRMLSPL